MASALEYLTFDLDDKLANGDYAVFVALGADGIRAALSNGPATMARAAKPRP
jgi:hypothetical protein